MYGVVDAFHMFGQFIHRTHLPVQSRFQLFLYAMAGMKQNLAFEIF